MRRTLLTTLLAGVALGATAAPAAAVTLHAAPRATATALPCAEAAPCRIDYALAAAAAGDDVQLAPGDYYLTGSTPFAGLPDVAAGVAVHGSPTGPRPVLHGEILANAVPFLRVAGRLSDVTADVSIGTAPDIAYALSLADGSLADRVTVHAHGRAGKWLMACASTGGEIRNSVCHGDGPGRVDGVNGITGNPVTYEVRNVTAITTAATGYGVHVGQSNKTTTMNVTNTIARGVTADVSATAGLAGGRATMNIAASNFTTQDTAGTGTGVIAQGTGNQVGGDAPRFVDAAAGDFRQADGSRTIDAGVTASGNGPLALGGTPREVGRTTDIGADEFVPAPPAPAPPAAPAPTADPSPDPGVAGSAGGGPKRAETDTLAPTLSTVRLARRWRTSARLRFVLSEPGVVTARISSMTTTRCGKPTPCRRLRPRGRITLRAATAGRQTLRLSRRLAGRRLAPGLYRVELSAVDAAGNQAVAKRLTFRISR